MVVVADPHVAARIRPGSALVVSSPDREPPAVSPAGRFAAARYVLGVVTLLCNIHEQMLGYVFVLQNPYFARVAADGSYVIDGVPDGGYSVALWSERSSRPGRSAVVRGGPVEISFAGP